MGMTLIRIEEAVASAKNMGPHLIVTARRGRALRKNFTDMSNHVRLITTMNPSRHRTLAYTGSKSVVGISVAPSERTGLRLYHVIVTSYFLED
jgi:riboflavin synthase alpha subunit